MSWFPAISPTTFAISSLVLVALAYFTVTTIISYRRLSHIPGPRLAAFSQLWLFNVTLKGDLCHRMEKELRKYGSVIRIGPNMIIHEDPDILRTISAVRSPFVRGHWFSAMKFDPRINNLLSERDEKRHAELRAKMMPGYSGKAVPTLEAKVDTAVLAFVNLIRSYVAKREPFDFAAKVQFFTMDSITDLAFGQPFGFLAKDADLYDYNRSSTEFFPAMELATNIPLIWDIISSRPMQALAAPKPEDRRGFGAIIGVAQKIVAERFNPQEEKPNRELDMLDAFIANGLTQLEAESESLLQILAGSDSTATCIRMVVLYLLTNPATYAKLRSEIDAAIATGSVSSPVIKNTEAVSLPYLQAVLREGMRLWFPLNGLGTMDTPKEGVTIKDIYIPGGTQVCLCKHAMLRRKDFFGDDAEMFRPERWLDADAEKVKDMKKVWDVYFAPGRFSCLGKDIGMMELNKVIFELLKRFDLGLVNPVNTMKTKCHQLHVQKDMNVQAWERTAN